METIIRSLLACAVAVLAHNPAFPGLYADPNIVVFNGTYYVYTTTDGVSGWGGQTFYVWYSDDLVTWTRTQDPILTLDGEKGDVPWSNGNAWAPTIVKRDFTYYLYFSGNNALLNRKTIGVASASSPLGPFKAQPEPMITNDESITTSQAIDPAAFVDPKTGKYYLFWGNGSPLMAELADDMTALKEDSIQKAVGLTNFTEASFVVYREPYYHYTFSSGDTGKADYYVGYGTATDVAGPWEFRGKILQQDPAQGILSTGSSSNVMVPGKDEWYIAYHRWQVPGGDGTHREVCLDKLQFDKETGLISTVHPTL
ncbi:Arabinanase/levansucrase/invertase [Teratosphaeria nubilosa]|uniref:Arabinanase/levansucrase/invertase n=1 Tax=Teratosphaeria nubilosa TaxID=161662 RepID=A0A6G1LP93_9PEZI|nr:Arabinanase/levansucrase/invertase [Teratosphaeria nubilosa]